MSLIELFTAHPKKNGLTWFNHFKRAAYISFVLSRAAILCFIHSIFPFLFTKVATKAIIQITKEIEPRDQDGSQ